MKTILSLFVAVIAILLTSDAYANEQKFVSWKSSNIQLLRGQNYKLGENERTIVSLEHANQWHYGDFFGFSDITFEDNGNVSYYIEPTLRLSLAKISGKNVSSGFVKDIFAAGQVEIPENRKMRILGGIGVDLNIPTFRFVKVNLFLRDNPELQGHTYQTNIAWNRPFKLGSTQFLLEGFADIVGSEGLLVENQLVVPRLLMDISSVTGLQEKKIWLGVEWQYWHNKFGVDGVTESVPQLQLKYVF